MTETGGTDVNGARRVCTRRGCRRLVNKPTAKYCSVRCCALDPERRARISARRRRAHATPLPMTHQLSLTLGQAGFDPEAQLAEISAGRDDVPAGMSRLVG